MDDQNINTKPPILKMQGISKYFPGVQALKDVEFDLREGEVHVLLGENGAGKSTLMKILVGIYKPDEGVINLYGDNKHFHSYKDAQDAGISIVYQEFNLVEQLSVAENVFFGNYPMKRGCIDWQAMEARTDELLTRLEVSFNARDKVRSLSTAQQQMVEIAKVLNLNSKIIILDEPTASLTEKEIARLFEVLNELKQEGVSIVYISHRLEEIQMIGDRVTILRDGMCVDTRNLQGVSMDTLIELMVGRQLNTRFPKVTTKPGEVVLEVKHLNRGTVLKNVDFYVRKGEIVGFSGLMGSGRTEAMRALFGADDYDSGDIIFEGKHVNIHSPHDAIALGIGLLTEDRKNQGLILANSVEYNISLTNLKKIMKQFSFFKVLDKKQEASSIAHLVDTLNIKTPSIQQKVQFLSGGNQQKVVLAKWLNRDCKVLIFDEPTRGIDVGAKAEIYKLMNTLVERGVAIIMISSELPEVIGMSDRIYVMHDGVISGELKREAFSQNVILQYAAGLL